MGQKNKTSKGEVSITNADGQVRLRWRHNGDRYSLNLPYAFTDYNLPRATITAMQIKLDLLTGCFDTTLEKYRDQQQGPDQKIVPGQPQDDRPDSITLIADLVEQFDQWASAIRNVDVENTAYYYQARLLLDEWSRQPVESIPVLLNGKAWSASTYNDRLGCLRHFLEHLVKKGKLSSSPLDDVVRRRKNRKKSPKREPLTEAEILRFLDAIKTDKYCPKSSRYTHSHYHPFFYFIFSTGVRNAEAIGLRVKHVLVSQAKVEISETLARTKKGTHHAARIRKGTKTENTRYLPLTAELLDILLPLIQGKGSDDLVFLSPHGLSINDHTLQQRVFKPIMRKLELGDKDLYAARHSFGTRSTEQGVPVTTTAYNMGHKTIETTMRNYVSVGKGENKLPRLGS